MRSSTANARTEAIETARQWLEQKPLYLDTETTGIGPKDEIIEIGIIDYNGEVLYETLVKPVGMVSPDAYRVHGISNKMLEPASRWMRVWLEVEPILSNRVVAIYNADFDLRLIQQSHQHYKIRADFPGNPVCVMKLYAKYYGEYNPRTMDYKWQSLENAGRQCGISLPNSHHAIDDVLLTRALLEHMAIQA